MNEIHQDLMAAIECSVYHAPREPGLTFQEMIEVGSQVGYQRGELGDAITAFSRGTRIADGRLQLPPNTMLADFIFLREPEYRNRDAFEFVAKHLRDLVKAVGRDQARIPRETLVAQGVAKGQPETALEVAITLYLLEGRLVQDKDGLLHFALGQEGYALPSQQMTQLHGAAHRRPRMARVFEVSGRRDPKTVGWSPSVRRAAHRVRGEARRAGTRALPHLVGAKRLGAAAREPGVEPNDRLRVGRRPC
jgi:hypothetical protein